MCDDEIEVVIVGTLIFEGLPAARDGIAEVRLLDIAFEDTPAITIAIVRFEVTGIRLQAGFIPFRLEARVSTDRDYAVAAELHLHGGGELRPGDLLTTERRSWRSGRVKTFDLHLHAVS